MMFGKNVQILNGDETQMSAMVRYQTNNTFIGQEVIFFKIYFH